jgi:hypothetical protein
MKTKLLIIISFFLFTINLKAQFTLLGYEEASKLKNTKTYVVLSEDNEIFNKQITAAVNKEWKQTEVDYIYFKDLNKYSGSSKNSFLLMTGKGYKHDELYNGQPWGLSQVISHTKFYDHNPLVTVSSNMLTLQIGGADFNVEGAVGNFNLIQKNWIFFCYIGVDYVGAYSEKMTTYISLLNNAVDLVIENKLKRLFVNESKKLINKKISLRGHKVIFWDRDIPQINQMDKPNKKYLNEAGIGKVFSGEFAIVDDDELREIINTKDDKYLFLGTYVDSSPRSIGNSYIYLYNSLGEIKYFSKVRESVETVNWFKMILKNIDKAVKK